MSVRVKGTSADSFLAKTRLVAVDARDVREIVEYSSLAIAYWRVSQSSTRLYHSQPAPAPAGNLHVPVRALQEGSQRLRCVTSSARPSRCTSTSPQSPFHYRHTPPLRELLSLASPCLTLSLSLRKRAWSGASLRTTTTSSLARQNPRPLLHIPLAI